MDNFELCPKFEKALNLLGKRWTSMILYKLMSGKQRFCELDRTLPVSGRLLSERLKELECEGIVVRDVYPENPVRIEYSLSQKGTELIPSIELVEKWASKWITTEEEECGCMEEEKTPF